MPYGSPTLASNPIYSVRVTRTGYSEILVLQRQKGEEESVQDADDVFQEVIDLFDNTSGWTVVDAEKRNLTSTTITPTA